MSATFSKIEVITGVACRQRFTTVQKLSFVKETLQLGKISYVARRHGLSPRSSSASGEPPAAIPSKRVHRLLPDCSLLIGQRRP
jgi:hypothetical protein